MRARAIANDDHEHVWDQSFDGITNIVDVYVRHLRNKVDDPYEHS